jgi:P-type conjugative transfer protein TrbJ
MRVRVLRAALIAAALNTSAILIAPPASAQLAVIDASNLAQNILQAARALQQINNQIQALQNQAVMLQNMARNLTSLNFSQLNAITGDLQEISSLMNRAQTLSFDVQAVETLFQRHYPQQYSANTTFFELANDAQTRWQTARDAFQQTMMVQSQITRTVQSDTIKLADLVNTSQGAVGALQASQATNQLLALSIKQQLQLQTLLAAQARADALSEAGNAQNKQAASAANLRFLGSGKAYTPR